jgi:hypothetical protein
VLYQVVRAFIPLSEGSFLLVEVQNACLFLPVEVQKKRLSISSKRQFISTCSKRRFISACRRSKRMRMPLHEKDCAAAYIKSLSYARAQQA